MDGMAEVPAAVAAVRLGMARDTLVRRIQLGLIKGRQVAGRWVMAQEEIDRLLDERTAKTA